MTRDELLEGLPDVQRRDYRAVEIEGKSCAEQAYERGVEKRFVRQNVEQAKSNLEEWSVKFEHIPDHLTIDNGRLRCRCCRRPITIGSDRVEYGHSRWARHRHSDGRCPHRPDSVDPRKPSSTPVETGDVVKGPDGLFHAATDGGEST